MRPSSYSPDVVPQVEALVAQGYSMTAVAGGVGVATSTLYEWANTHEELSEAIKRARPAGIKWWEDKHRAAIEAGQTYNMTGIIFGLKNRARDEWADVQTQRHVGADGGAVQIETSVDSERVARRIAFLLAQAAQKPTIDVTPQAAIEDQSNG